MNTCGRVQLFLHSLFTVCLLCLACAPGKESARQIYKLKVMTYNIHHAEGTDGKVDVERMARVINDSQADLVALQEVDRGVERTKKVDIMTSLSDLTGMTYAFGKNIDFQGGEYGNGALTRFPITAENNLHFAMLRSGEQRGLLQLVVEIQGQEIVFMNTHLDYRADDAERLMNAVEIIKVAESYAPRPVIVCGDLNDLPDSRTLTKLKTDFIDCWEVAGTGQGFTYSTLQPSKRIDYILLKKNKSDATSSASMRPISARILSSNASDHLPLVVEFEFKPEFENARH
jgi:endonuclease/exonuclease/phosphatase family metal-dependent hydrolase